MGLAASDVPTLNKIRSILFLLSKTSMNPSIKAITGDETSMTTVPTRSVTEYCTLL